MPKLNYCLDGSSVTEKVLKYQQTRKNDDYLPVKEYYDNFRDWWFRNLQEYMDREIFDAEFDFKLCKAINSFDKEQAIEVAEKYNLNFLGMFNRWFYRILSNWRSNEKSTSFRAKNRPPVQCPVCGRWVARINEEHLAHYKTISDMPGFVTVSNRIYETKASPATFITTWGQFSKQKMQDLENGYSKPYLDERKKVRWPFYQENRKRGVMCPFTKKIVPVITNEYLRGLDKSYNRYAQPMTWTEFQEEHPMVLIQSEIYSVDYSASDDTVCSDLIAKSYTDNYADHNNLEYLSTNKKFEESFNLIDYFTEDDDSRQILKLIAIGYGLDDISDVLIMDKKEIKKKIREIRDSCVEMKTKLLEVC